MIKSRFYFAHPITMYNTGSESAIQERFNSEFPEAEVENPNQPHHAQGYKDKGMDYFVELCNDQDGVFFASHSDGSIGAGVRKEVQSFLDRGAPVFYFEPKELAFRSLNGPAALSAFGLRDVPSTRALLKTERALKSQGNDPFQELATFRQSVLSGSQT